MKLPQRKFSLGSEWVYIKIYTGYRSADHLIINELYTISNFLLKNGIIKKYFFLRLSDPLYHIRFRFHLKEAADVGKVILLINKSLDFKLHNGIIKKIQFDTYDRELERYHNLLIEQAEEFFYFDSLCITKIIKDVINNDDEDKRWIAGIYLITSFLETAQISFEDRFSLMNELATDFKKEFGFDMYNSKQLNVKYRENSKIITDIVNKQFSLKNIYRFVDDRNKKIEPIINEIKLICENNKLNDKKYFKSYLHMTINRLFPVKNRLHELLLYEFTSRHYKSILARNKMDK